jgi:hypothetical protein
MYAGLEYPVGGNLLVTRREVSVPAPFWPEKRSSFERIPVWAQHLLKRHAEIAIETVQSMKAPNRLRKISISLSLVILALGFSALGFVSFIGQQPDYTGSIFSVEHVYSLIGSSFSVLVGATFLVAAITFKGVNPISERLSASIDAKLI